MHSLRPISWAACCTFILGKHAVTPRYVGRPGPPWLSWSMFIGILSLCTTFASAMSMQLRDSLRSDTVNLFYHGYDNYMRYAFPEDELRPLTCAALTRDRANPAHIELNDVLGNYSLTLIDSLSTLAILASSPESTKLSSPSPNEQRHNALHDFQDGIQMLVQQYGDGTEGPSGKGERARGFDLDSKVQVFETVIRGVGGLLSAHLFAVGELPIRGYTPEVRVQDGRKGIYWNNGLIYDGQLLRLAKDLGERLLPAFFTPTHLPYPRVNLRHGVPFYPNSPLNANSEGSCPRHQSGKPEITETCSAGAGSLVLEFTTLSRLTGDGRFELAAKAAFWAVWERRSEIGLIGAGIDAESGQWVHSFTGIGAGIDSFFEYAFKSHVLLSGLPETNNNMTKHSSDSFLETWEEAHAAIHRHVYRGDVFQHPHYIQTDLYTGAARYFWIDSLSAYYPGLLTLAGELEEATAAHLLYAALWNRYSAMPERWSVYSGDIEGGLRWWGGRPEFIESSWYLYRATKDPWYLHIGEMTLRDIQRRCWTKCGWAGLQDVKTGEQTDRMESFFLGETAKYLYLLFDEDHPLNHLDAPFVFTTEGHPLIVPRRAAKSAPPKSSRARSGQIAAKADNYPQPVCPAPAKPLPLTVSAIAARGDLFHAAALARMNIIPSPEASGHDRIHVEPENILSNYTTEFFPWTLPTELIPLNGTSTRMMTGMTFDLSFPSYDTSANIFTSIDRTSGGLVLNTLSGARFGMVRESDSLGEYYRIYAIGTFSLGRDEKVFLSRELVSSFNPTDPYFTRIKDRSMLDLLLDIPANVEALSEDTTGAGTEVVLEPKLGHTFPIDAGDSNILSSLLTSLQHIFQAHTKPTPNAQFSKSKEPGIERHMITAAMPTGPGAAVFATLDDEPSELTTTTRESPFTWKKIYYATHNLCNELVPSEIVTTHNILVIPRGGCSFSTKLSHIPSYPPSSSSLQLVIVISSELDTRNREWATSPRTQPDPESHTHDVNYDIRPIQPLLDMEQLTPAGLKRANPIPMILIEGANGHTEELLRRAHGVGIRRRWWYETQGIRIDNLVVL